MDRWNGKIAVVTGAGSGNGAAITKDLLRNYIKVIGLDINLEALENLKRTISNNFKENFFAKKCNVTDFAEVDAVFEWIFSNFDGIDILVNNAGVARDGNLCTMDPKDVQFILNTNVMGYVHCTRKAFINMKTRKFDGHIILINSALGHRVVPLGNSMSVNIYAPSKFAITAMTEIYREEFFSEGTKIKITSISPGMVHTPMIGEEVKEKVKNILYPEDIAQAVIYAISTPPHVQIHEISLKPFGEPV
ncbi:farnesol dehydrogenase-like [Condylostylus longicornis]|uniref:farnesol dehydrogenase-like n=1 Tax=Condylostylus longicornis TaxID=2530218 RepID=UPI00244DBB95|nr:farnesol dehydrogenase-like [Condylostylus longicornis]